MDSKTKLCCLKMAIYTLDLVNVVPQMVVPEKAEPWWSGDPPSGREEAAQQQTVSGASRTRLFTREQLPSFSPRKPREESKEILVAGQAST